jgi:DNA modification methylase
MNNLNMFKGAAGLMFELHNENCLKTMDKMIKNGITCDLILTDPPYNISKKNNFNTMRGVRVGIDFGDWDKGFDQFEWIDKGTQVLGKNGSMVIFNSWQNIGNIAKYAEESGMDIKDCIRWEKSNPMPRNIDRRYVVDYEMAVWLVKKKSKWTFNRFDPKYERPLFKCGIVQGAEKTLHPTQKPIALMEHLIKIHSNENDIVFDPFLGSGTVGEACKNLNRKFIGVELDPKYFKIAEERLLKINN